MNNLNKFKKINEEASKGPWPINIVVAAVGLESSGWAHQITIGNMDYTIAHHDHINYQRIERKGNVSTGIGSIPYDKKPHPNALFISTFRDAAPAILAVIEAAQHIVQSRSGIVVGMKSNHSFPELEKAMKNFNDLKI